MVGPDEMQCPHCRKSFRADLLGPETARAGYKCPHCRLFVPLDRTDEPDQTAASA
ncbi:MAG: hypothetical protein M3P42_02185 [Actinomycetota bacterium]|nr:hypothetical protein [Actinomycetota bacterium]